MADVEKRKSDVRAPGEARHGESEEGLDPVNAPQPQPQPPPEGEYFSPEEAATAIAGLDAKGKATLRMIARSYWKVRMSGPDAGSDPDDLLQEAIVRTLQGSRRWRRSVTIIKHLARAMQSISWDAVRARRAQQHGWAEDSVEEIDPGDLPNDSHESTVVDAVIARDELALIEGLFEQDQEAFEVLRCRSIGLIPSETCKKLGMDRSRYDTVNKRIWRKITASTKNNQTEEGQ